MDSHYLGACMLIYANNEGWNNNFFAIVPHFILKLGFQVAKIYIASGQGFLLRPRISSGPISDIEISYLKGMRLWFH